MRTSIFLLLLVSCFGDETGIDHTVLTGTITIPPVTADDGRTNNDLATAQPLGPDESVSLTYRSVVVSGTVNDWTPGLGGTYGDPDHYAFSPAADGTMAFTLSFTTAQVADGDTGATVDADVFDVQLIDPSAIVECADGGGDTADTGADTGAPCVANDGVLWSSSSAGSGGVFSFAPELTAGTTYVLLVAGASTDDAEEQLAYTLLVGGSTPGDSTVLVGAYAGSDPLVGEDPLGGTTATGWVYDAATYTWSGTWQVMWIRKVTPAPPDEDTGDVYEPSPTVEEGAERAYIRAGTLNSLNAGPAAGALYTTTSIEVAVTGTTAEVADGLVLDGVAPKVIGIQVAETLPDETVADVSLADTTLDPTTLVAQEIGMLSGLGYVDIITGSSTFDPTFEGWGAGNDSDAFAFTVPESMYVRMKASWPDSTADIDLGIFYEDADYGYIDLFGSFGESYCMTGDDPEICTSVVTLEPEISYWVIPLAYAGTDEQAYTIELEWISP